MYAYLQGNITYKSPTLIHLDVGGIGFAIHISLHTYADLEPKEKAKIWVHQIVKEDDLALYGFSTEVEKELFVLLIGVNGIGPNTARLVLSSLRPADLQHAIMAEDVSTFKAVKGVGPKTAMRLIIDLKDKVAKVEVLDPMSGEKIVASHSGESVVKREAQQALVALGFTNAAVQKVLGKIVADNPTARTEEVLKLALRALS